MILFKLLCVTCICWIGLTEEIKSNGTPSTCKPSDPLIGASQWIKKYKLETRGDGLIFRTILSSNFTQKYITKDREVLDNYVMFGLSLYKPENRTQLPFRKLNTQTMAMIHHGQAAVFHTLNPHTKKYSVFELGVNTQKYFQHIPLGTWYAIDIPAYNTNPVLLGFTIWQITEISWATKSELLKDYPQYPDLIDSFTLR